MIKAQSEDASLNRDATRQPGCAQPARTQSWGYAINSVMGITGLTHYASSASSVFPLIRATCKTKPAEITGKSTSEMFCFDLFCSFDGLFTLKIMGTPYSLSMFPFLIYQIHSSTGKLNSEHFCPRLKSSACQAGRTSHSTGDPKVREVP